MRYFLVLALILFSCEKIVGDYRYFYKVYIATPRAIVTYRVKSTGKNKTDTLRHPGYYLYANDFTYIWYNSSPDDKYYIDVKNDTTVGYIKVIVGRNMDTLHIDSTTTSVMFRKR